MTTVRVGQDLAITVTILDIDGNPGNPSQVRFTVGPPAGPILIYTLASANVQTMLSGVKYRCIFDASMSGFWKCKVEALNTGGVVVAVDQKTYYVAP